MTIKLIVSHDFAMAKPTLPPGEKNYGPKKNIFLALKIRRKPTSPAMRKNQFNSRDLMRAPIQLQCIFSYTILANPEVEPHTPNTYQSKLVPSESFNSNKCEGSTSRP